MPEQSRLEELARQGQRDGKNSVLSVDRVYDSVSYRLTETALNGVVRESSETFLGKHHSLLVNTLRFDNLVVTRQEGLKGSIFVTDNDGLVHFLLFYLNGELGNAAFKVASVEGYDHAVRFLPIGPNHTLVEGGMGYGGNLDEIPEVFLRATFPYTCNYRGAYVTIDKKSESFHVTVCDSRESKQLEVKFSVSLGESIDDLFELEKTEWINARERFGIEYTEYS